MANEGNPPPPDPSGRGFARAVARAYRDVLVHEVNEKVWNVLLGWVNSPEGTRAQADAFRIDEGTYRGYRRKSELPFRTLVQILMTQKPKVKDFIDIRTAPPARNDPRRGCIIRPGVANDLRFRACAASLNIGFQLRYNRAPETEVDEGMAAEWILSERRPPEWESIYREVIAVLENTVGFNP
jgi:hypothetical protein